MAEALINLEIDGKAVEVSRGATIIEAADAAGIRIPRFCYHKKLSVAANCRMCLVEVEKAPKPVPACAFPVADGMKVFTQSARALDAQRGTMEFLLINHPLDCPICDQGGECELQDVAMGYGHDVSRYNDRKRVVKDRDLGPLVSTDMTRCIHCTRCVRFGEEIAGLRELGATGRGEFMKIGTFVEKSLNSELSGNIIDLCPVGALNAKPSRMSARAWEMSQHATIAPHDSVGSNVYLHVLRGRVVRAVPRESESLNETWLSDRDRFSYQALGHEERLLSPEAIKYREPRSLDWDEALSELKDQLGRYAPDEIGAWISPTAPLEEHYLLQKLLRGLGCHNIDHRMRQADFEADEAAPLFPWLGMSHEALESLDSVLIVGCDVRREQPLAGLRIRKAALRGATVMALNPRDFEFTFPLAEQMLFDTVAMVHQLAAIAARLYELKGEAIPQDESSLRNCPVDDAAARSAERLLAGSNAGVIVGAVAHNSPYFSVISRLANIVSRLSGATLSYWPEFANSAGAWLAGSVPHRGPLGQAITGGGHHFRQMTQQPPKLLLLWNVEPEFDCHDPVAAVDALKAAECVIGFTNFASKSCREHIDYLLPLAAYAENSGTYVNAEGRWQSFEPVIAPAGDSKPGWKVLRALANTLGVDGFDYSRVTEVRDELKAMITDDFALNNRSDFSGPLQLPARPEGLFASSSVGLYCGDAHLRRAPALQATPEARSSECIMISPEQARILNLQDQSEVRLSQGERTVVLPLRRQAGIPTGSAYFQSGTRAAAAIGPAFGSVTLSPVGQE